MSTQPLDPVFRVGAAAVDITPKTSQFLFGYPHVERYSSGVHDPLYATAVAIAGEDGATVVLVATDVIFVSKSIVSGARARIAARLADRRAPSSRRNETTGALAPGTPAEELQIIIGATHTHSGPITVDHASNSEDPVVPEADEGYVAQLEDGIVQAAIRAVETMVPASLFYAVAGGSAVGTNRHDPTGPSNPSVPVFLAKDADGTPIAMLLGCAMHPTVLHEDSLLVSADFPGATRKALQSFFHAELPIAYFTAPCGNLSPRHVTRENTFAEAERIGTALATSIADALGQSQPLSPVVSYASRNLELPPREMPSVATAEVALAEARRRHQVLRDDKTAAATARRSAEVDVFGAEETLTLARLQSTGGLEAYRKTSMPAEISIVRIGDVALAFWPGEFFVEYALEVEAAVPGSHVVSLTGGELQGYIVTRDAVERRTYEAGNALFAAESGPIVVQATVELLTRTAPGA